jgi:hypothetical protein
MVPQPARTSPACYVARMFSSARVARRAAFLLALAGFAGPGFAADTAPPDEAVAARASPARVGGLWCGAGLLGDFSLEIVQRHRDVSGKLVRKGRVREITGHVDGSMLRTDPQRNESLDLQAVGDELRIAAGTGPLALLRGQSFRRASEASCSH